MAEAKRSWQLMLFGLPFAAVGIGFMLFGVIPSVYDWARMQSWQPVQAHLLSAHLEVHRGDDATTYGVTASYRYRFAGQDRQASRVAIAGGSDNVGDFQRQLGRRLEWLHQQGESVAIWVNPDNPDEAVIDRSLRPGMLMFKLVFALVFGLVGCGIIWAGWRRQSASEPFAPVAEKPWLSQPQWAGNAIASNHKSSLWASSLFAILWLLISSPIVFLLPEELRKHNYLALIGLLFPLVGLGLLWWAIAVARDWRRWGDLRVQMDPFPGCIGGQVGASLELPLTYDPKLRMPVALVCFYKHTSGSGDNRETRDSTVWQAEGMVYLQPSAGGCRAQILFDVPPDLPASERGQDNYHYWRLDIECDQVKPALKRQFEIPVFPGEARAHFLTRESTQAPAMREQREQAIDAVSDLEQIPGGVRLYFPYGRSWRGALIAFFGGAFCLGVGLAVRADGGPLIFPLVFGGFGVPLMLGGFYTLSNSLTVTLDRQGLATERRLLGIPWGSKRVAAADLLFLRLVESYSSSQSGGRQVTFYKIQAYTRSGKKITLAESLRGRETAQQLLESIALLSGYPTNCKA